MIRVLWLLGGLVVGISMGRNSQPFAAASTAAVIVLLVLAGALTWWAGRRDLRASVASAVSSAVAAAHVDFDAQLHAQAVALQQQHVTVYGGDVHARRACEDGGGRSLSAPPIVSLPASEAVPSYPVVGGHLEQPVTWPVTESPA